MAKREHQEDEAPINLEKPLYYRKKEKSSSQIRSYSCLDFSSVDVRSFSLRKANRHGIKICRDFLIV